MIKINFADSFYETDMRIVEIQEVLEKIKTEHWKKEIDKIRYHFSNGETNKASSIKQKLPVFTISATFKGGRKKENLDSYTGLLHLDYDKVDNVQELKAKVVDIPYTYAAFISPSGNGLKVLVKSDNILNTHVGAFNALRGYYDGSVGRDSDSSVKDFTRLCFVSYDADLYINEDAEVFKYQPYPNNETKSQKDIGWVWDFTSNKQHFAEGNRNNFFHLFACNANRFDYNINETLNYAYLYSDSTFDKKEIDITVKSVYKNNVNEKGSAAKFAISAILPNDTPQETTSPYIPEHIYDVLPVPLKEACNVFKGRERDIFLTAALSVISGGLHNVYGLYSNDKVFPNLFSFIVAPAASGKGVMKYSRQLGDCYHDELFNQSKENFKKYKKEKRVFDLKLKKAKTDQAIEALREPEKPKSKMFFIPGDTSSAMIVKHLEFNDGMGCICETEADTLTNTLKQDWGGYSDVLRKGFQGEIIVKSRITDFVYSEIKEPKFSIAITGTPNQLDSLMTSVQDGLFSRFLFYSFDSAPKWKSTYTTGVNRSNKEIFEDYSAALCDKFKNEVTQKFIMTEVQGHKLDSAFKDSLNHSVALYNENVAGTVYRLGLMCFKIAMVLSAIRSDNPEITCSDEDFNTAMCLVEKVYLTHSINMLNRVTKNSKDLNTTQTTLHNWIKTKDECTRAEILVKSTSLGVKDRTLTDILNRFITLKLIKKIRHGVYAKT